MWREVKCGCYLCSSLGRLFFPSGFFRIFLYLWLSIVWEWYAVFLTSMLLGVLWTYWVWLLVYDINSREYLRCYCSKYLLMFLFFSSLDIYYVCLHFTFCTCPVVLGYSAPILFFVFNLCFLCFSVLEVSVEISSSFLWLEISFRSHVKIINNSIKGFLHFFCSIFLFVCFVVVVFISSISFLGFPSLCLHCPFVLARCLLYADKLESLAY